MDQDHTPLVDIRDGQNNTKKRGDSSDSNYSEEGDKSGEPRKKLTCRQEMARMFCARTLCGVTARVATYFTLVLSVSVNAYVAYASGSGFFDSNNCTTNTSADPGYKIN